MDNTTAQLAEQLKNNPAMLRSLMQSRDGQMLMQLLTKDDNGTGLQQAVQSAVRGNTAQMAEMVKRVMQNPDGAALVERINKAIQK
jgi:hypothetical protein